MRAGFTGQWWTREDRWRGEGLANSEPTLFELLHRGHNTRCCCADRPAQQIRAARSQDCLSPNQLLKLESKWRALDPKSGSGSRSATRVWQAGVARSAYPLNKDSTPPDRGKQTQVHTRNVNIGEGNKERVDDDDRPKPRT